MQQDKVRIGNKIIGEGHPVFIIAEAGVNHNGSLKLAKRMIDVAKEAGADAVKFQTYNTEALITLNAPKAEYQKKTVPVKSQYEMLKSLELSSEVFKELFNYCRHKKIIFFSTPFDLKSADFLNKLRVPAFKISSGELTNVPLLEQISRFGKPIILSTGMATILEIEEAVKTIYAFNNRRLVLLHCTSNYPAEFKNVNLKAMQTMQKMFKLPVGYSDHTNGVEVAVAAVALGAAVIEKHFTLDKKLSGPDHLASLSPEELFLLVRSIRNIEQAMGDGAKTPRRSEIEVQRMARKSIVAINDIQRGAILSANMLTVKRPGTGIPPKYIDRIIGRRAKKDINKDSVVKWSQL
jgi:N-acetylneuraminate synthase/N,N'-diacetyllegionaminate synthase